MSGFADRLAYVRWLRWLRSGERAPETDGEFAAAVGVSGGWVAKWKSRDDSPDRRTETSALERALAPMGITGVWLFDGTGEAPEPERWDEWIAARRSRTAKLEAPDIPAPRPAAKEKRKGA